MKLAHFPQKRSKCHLTYGEFCIVLSEVFESLKDIWDGSIIQPLLHVHRVLALAAFGPSYECGNAGGGKTTTPSRRLAPNRVGDSRKINEHSIMTRGRR